MTVALGLAAVGLSVVAIVLQRWTIAALAVVAVALASWSAGGLDRDATGDGIYAMAFVAGMVLVAAAAEHSGLLKLIARRTTAPLRRPGLLLAVTFLAATALTTVLNLDTTAVLFTPLALSVAAETKQPVVPFALASILGANFGSMLLPTSNLTNLVLWRHTGVSFATFMVEQAPVAAVAVVLTVVVLVVASRRQLVAIALTPRITPPPAATIAAEPSPITDRSLALASGASVVVLTIGFVAGLPVAPAALIAGGALLAVRRRLWRDRLPSVLIVSVIALFAAAGALRSGLDVADHAGSVSPLGLALIGAAASNVGSNLAAVLVLQPLASSAALSKALLIGVNLGVGITPIASLATILWRDALRTRGVRVPWRSYFAVAVPLSIVFLALTPLLAR